MQRQLRLLQVSTTLLAVSMLFATADYAMESETISQDGVLVAAEMKGGKEKDHGGKPCDPGPPCLTHTPTAQTNDLYYPYGGNNICALNVGKACNLPNEGRCGPSNIGTCQTVNTGNNICACTCMIPQE